MFYITVIFTYEMTIRYHNNMDALGKSYGKDRWKLTNHNNGEASRAIRAATFLGNPSLSK